MRRAKTKDGLVEVALHELAKTERPIGVQLTPAALAMIDKQNREKRREILQQLLKDSLFADW